MTLVLVAVVVCAVQGSAPTRPHFTTAESFDWSVPKFTVAFPPATSVRYGYLVSCVWTISWGEWAPSLLPNSAVPLPTWVRARLIRPWPGTSRVTSTKAHAPAVTGPVVL